MTSYTMKDMTEKYHCFGGIWCFSLKCKYAQQVSSKCWYIPTGQTTWLHISEDCNFFCLSASLFLCIRLVLCSIICKAQHTTLCIFIHNKNHTTTFDSNHVYMDNLFRTLIFREMTKWWGWWYLQSSISLLYFGILMHHHFYKKNGIIWYLYLNTDAVMFL
jgi:hypothetical protein